MASTRLELQELASINQLERQGSPETGQEKLGIIATECHGRPKVCKCLQSSHRPCSARLNSLKEFPPSREQEHASSKQPLMFRSACWQKNEGELSGSLSPTTPMAVALEQQVCLPPSSPALSVGTCEQDNTLKEAPQQGDLWERVEDSP